MIQSVPIILDIKQKSDKVIYVHALYLQLFCVTSFRTLQHYLDEKKKKKEQVDVYFLKNCKQEFPLLLSVLQVHIY